MQVEPGDILLTRNMDVIGNDSPGYWNHSAMLSNDDLIIEAQAAYGVIATPVWSFFERYPEILVLRDNRSTRRQTLANYVIRLVGRPYLKGGSFGPRWKYKLGDNCVSVIRRSYVFVGGFDPMWIKPDDITKSYLLTTPVAHKKEYDIFIEPKNRFAGIVNKL